MDGLGFQLTKFAIAKAWAEYPSASDGYGTSRMITKSDFSPAARRTRRHGLAPKFGSAPASKTLSVTASRRSQGRCHPQVHPAGSCDSVRMPEMAGIGLPRRTGPAQRGSGFWRGVLACRRWIGSRRHSLGNQPAFFSAGIRESMA